MTSFNFFVGVDISKLTLDFTVISEQEKIFYLQVSNDKKGICKFLKQAKKHKLDLGNTLFCCENTGIYTYPLASYLHENSYKLWVENPISIVKSQGFVRGKNDQIDSFRIAKYAKRFQDKCVLWTPKNEVLEQIK